jgi:hypothetical protein
LIGKKSPAALHCFIGKKSPAALFSDSGFVAAGKRRGFCRLRQLAFFQTTDLVAAGKGAAFAGCVVKSR